MDKRVLAIAAHPDDIEFQMAGTMIQLKKAGYELHYMNIANGSCGSDTLDKDRITAIRREEAMAAAGSIGACFHESLTDDFTIYFEPGLLARIGTLVREIAPEILLVPSPFDYMEDHQNTCRLAVTAAFTRGMPNFRTDPPSDPVSQPVTLYHAQPYGNREPLGTLVQPGIFVDISDVIEEKTAMLALHRSQKKWLDETQGMDSYLDEMKKQSEEMGLLSERYAFAEGWRKRGHLGFCAPSDNPLCASLGDCAFEAGTALED